MVQLFGSKSEKSYDVTMKAHQMFEGYIQLEITGPSSLCTWLHSPTQYL